MSSLFLRAAATWLPAATVAVLLTGLVYVVGQQNLRTGANDPAQLADGAVARLDAGAALRTWCRPAPWTWPEPGGLHDRDNGSGAVLAGNAVLDGVPPAIPTGIFETARGGVTDTVTWQPRSGVRIAQATVGWRGGASPSGAP